MMISREPYPESPFTTGWRLLMSGQAAECFGGTASRLLWFHVQGN